MARKKFDNVVAMIKNNKIVGNLQQDNVMKDAIIMDIEEKTGLKPKTGLEKFLIVDDQIVNVVSKKYGMVQNSQFFGAMEERLQGAGIEYEIRSINRSNGSFAVDYILKDDSFVVKSNTGKDAIKPMIRLINSYDGSCQTSGHFGAFRQICTNGLHVADLHLDFQQRHRGNVIEIVLPKMEELIIKFIDNEYFSLQKKFEVLAEKPVSNISEFVKYVLGETGLFKYEKSEKNPDDASAGAILIEGIIHNEAEALGTGANLWLGYNAFNEYIHTATDKVFMLQEKADRKIFDVVMAMAN